MRILKLEFSADVGNAFILKAFSLGLFYVLTIHRCKLAVGNQTTSMKICSSTYLFTEITLNALHLVFRCFHLPLFHIQSFVIQFVK